MDHQRGLAGTVLARGIVLLTASLLQLTPITAAGMALATLKPAFLVLLFLQSPGGARKAFALALAATVASAFVDALTPSYDASALWSWATTGLGIAAELAVLGGFFQLSRARAGLLVMALGTLLWIFGSVADNQAPRLLAPFLWCLGHVLIFPSLRRRSTPPPEPFADAAGRGLFRWGLVELGRLIALGAGVAAAAAMSLSDRDATHLGLGVMLACAVMAAIGDRWLVAFCDGAAAAGVRSSLARAVPVCGVVVGAFILPDVAEALISDRAAALSRAGVAAVMACGLVALGVGAVAGAARRIAKRLGRRGLAASLGVTSWALWVIPLLLLLIAVADNSVSWQLRRTLQSAAQLLLVGFGLAWLGSAVLLVVAGLRARQPLV
jgi:hypothetical protein